MPTEPRFLMPNACYHIITRGNQRQEIFLDDNGNRKRHRTPTPSRLRKIKRISFKAFLSLKELFKNFRREAVKPLKLSNSLRRRALRINDLKAGIHLTRDIVSKNGSAGATRNNTPAYEPTQMSNAYNSSFWQWRRVAEWFRYIDDPYENIRGT